MTEAQHQISVIIPFYKGNRYLPECLASLETQGRVVGEVLFVVDNGSDPPVVPDDFSIPWGMIVNPEGVMAPACAATMVTSASIIAT